MGRIAARAQFPTHDRNPPMHCAGHALPSLQMVNCALQQGARLWRASMRTEGVEPRLECQQALDLLIAPLPCALEALPNRSLETDPAQPESVRIVEPVADQTVANSQDRPTRTGEKRKPLVVHKARWNRQCLIEQPSAHRKCAARDQIASKKLRECRYPVAGQRGAEDPDQVGPARPSIRVDANSPMVNSPYVRPDKRLCHATHLVRVPDIVLITRQHDVPTR